MKPLHSLALVIVMAATMTVTSCQKATLIDEPDTHATEPGRATEGSEPTDTVNITPDITTEGWGGSTDVGFEFG